MLMSKEFNDALKENDITSMRILMKDSLLMDRTFATIREMQAAAKDVPNLYQPFNNKELNRDKSQWNKDLMNRQLAELMMNFCPERIEYLEAIITAIYPKEEAATSSSANSGSKPGSHASSTTTSSHTTNETNVPYHVQKQRDREKGLISKVVYCTVGGAVVGATVSAATGANVLVGLGLGAAAGAIAGVIIKEINSK